MRCPVRGSVHRVYSGLCVWPAPYAFRRASPALRGAMSELRMDAFDDAELATYLDSRLWEGKAGAFGLQDRPQWIHLESGSPSNVVGLPMELLAELLAEVGVTPESSVAEVARVRAAPFEAASPRHSRRPPPR